MPRFAPLAALPAPVLGIAKEVLRHLLRRPVAGLAAVASVPDGRLVLVRRGDTGTWALPGGTVEWGETLESTLRRELSEEAGIDEVEFRGVVGVYSRPERDPRFHAVTVVVRADVAMPIRTPKNSMEITEVGLFEPDRVPRPLAMSMDDFLDAALAGGPPRFE